MPFLEILYGSQFEEIKNMGKDGNKGRLNANIFLSVMLMMVLGIIFFGLKILSSKLNDANIFLIPCYWVYFEKGVSPL